MRRFHLVFGAAVLVVFLLTGQYMDRLHNHLEGMADGPRLLYRTRHIFILLAGLANLCLGAYLVPRPERGARLVQLVGTCSVAAASLLFVAGFFSEPLRGDLRTPLSHWGTYTIALGTLLHVLGGTVRGDAGRGG